MAGVLKALGGGKSGWSQGSPPHPLKRASFQYRWPRLYLVNGLGSEYGGNKGVVESAAALGSTADPVPSLALGRAMVIVGHGVQDFVSKDESGGPWVAEEGLGTVNGDEMNDELKGLAGESKDSMEEGGRD
ncbi:hypothetical protein BY996DRAFT_6464907 [Phakopsora pachyrhizi]|nr:hypothetical protein BY996DRAFT_6464907 [Phakopsora pachyrhizi]